MCPFSSRIRARYRPFASAVFACSQSSQSIDKSVMRSSHGHRKTGLRMRRLGSQSSRCQWRRHTHRTLETVRCQRRKPLPIANAAAAAAVSGSHSRSELQLRLQLQQVLDSVTSNLGPVKSCREAGRVEARIRQIPRGSRDRAPSFGPRGGSLTPHRPLSRESSPSGLVREANTIPPPPSPSAQERREPASESVHHLGRAGETIENKSKERQQQHAIISPKNQLASHASF